MWNNIGKKLKTLTIVLFWIGIVFTVLLAAAVWYFTTQYSQLIPGATNLKQFGIYIGLAVLALGALCNFIRARIMYAIGEAAFKSQQAVDELSTLKSGMDTGRLEARLKEIQATLNRVEAAQQASREEPRQAQAQPQPQPRQPQPTIQFRPASQIQQGYPPYYGQGEWQQPDAFPPAAPQRRRQSFDAPGQ